MNCHDLPRKNTDTTDATSLQHADNMHVSAKRGNFRQPPRSLNRYIYNNISPPDDRIDDLFPVKDEFYSEVMPATRKKIAELISEADPDMKRQARTEYLKGVMEETIEEAFYVQDRFEDYLHRGRTVEAILERETYSGLVKKILDLQGEIISLRKPERPSEITEDMILRAREYPFAELHEFKRNQAVCPFHEDRDPSMHLFPDNHVYCFSCQKGWDTIAFVQERDGLSFPEAVKQLQ